MKHLLLIAFAALFVSCGGNKNNLDALNKLDSISNALNSSATGEKFTSVDGKFKIAFPAEPDIKSDTVATDVGIIEMISFTYEKSITEAYMIAYCDYPSEIVKKSDPDVLLQGAKEGALSSQKATMESDEKITLDGNPGYYFTAVKGDYYMCYKIFLKGNRLYQILMLRDGAYPSAEAVEEFMGSFELIK